jgi:hypothetical protein
MQTETQGTGNLAHRKTKKTNKRVVITILLSMMLFIMACGEGCAKDREFLDALKNMGGTEEVAVLIETEIAGETEPAAVPATAGQAEPAIAPTQPPAQAQDAPAEALSADVKEYAVSAQDFDCICQVSGNRQVEMKVNGNQLEVSVDGGEPKVYDKIGDNTYRMSWMGYYLLREEGQEEATKVEEERSAVIILNENGYVMEHYQGAEPSPCCIHTFTQVE